MAARKVAKAEAVEVRTSDLYYAGYLLTCGLPLDRTEVIAGVRVSMVFDAGQHDVKALERAWMSDLGSVPAQTYANRIKALKTLVHQALQEAALR